MRNCFKTFVAAIFCLTLLVLSGSVLALQCVDNEDGTVTDNTTGLTWQKDSDGPMNWDVARRHVHGRTLSGHSGFRLPDRGELEGLYHSPCSKAMHVESDWYWSSTTEPDYPECAWGVNFSNGEAHCGRKTHGVYVRAVRTQ
jgi:hypothetical protein